VSWESSPCALSTQLMVKVKIIFFIGTLPLRTVEVVLKHWDDTNTRIILLRDGVGYAELDIGNRSQIDFLPSAPHFILSEDS
jgi:hypothetical protein